jgi:DnaJ-class molecular chaperone
MAIKKAYEVLSDSDRRVLYDVFHQENFDNDDRMADTIRMRFKNKTEADS